MIARLRGRIIEKTPTRMILDVNGVGYEMHIPVSTFENIGEVETEQEMLTYQHVREDILQLYGFSNYKEKWMFTNLISVSGIGPKLALAVLSGSSADKLQSYIVNREVTALIRLPGIGKKTAERLVMELKDKLGDLPKSMGSEVSGESPFELGRFQEAVLALVSLGHTTSNAEARLSKIAADDSDLSLDELIKRALQTS